MSSNQLMKIQRTFGLLSLLLLILPVAYSFYPSFNIKLTPESEKMDLTLNKDGTVFFSKIVRGNFNYINNCNEGGCVVSLSEDIATTEIIDLESILITDLNNIDQIFTRVSELDTPHCVGKFQYDYEKRIIERIKKRVEEENK